MLKTDKEEAIKKVKENLEKSQAVFVTNLVGIQANEAVKIRKGVRDANGHMIITRNSLFERAAKGTFAEKLLSNLKGPTAVAFAFKDAPAVAKVIFDANKENEKVLLKGGVLEGKDLTAAEVVALAKLPSRDQMLGTLLATFNAPVSAFARVLFAIKEQKETQNA
ncbi:MAG: 50S ribosomal protein L10 [Bacteriovoracaceae bacterium]